MPARDISRLVFFGRILSEASHAQVPLLQRLRFASIAAAALDEFDAVRRACLWHSDLHNTLPVLTTMAIRKRLQRTYKHYNRWLHCRVKILLQQACSARLCHISASALSQPIAYNIVPLHDLPSHTSGVLLPNLQIAVVQGERWQHQAHHHYIDCLQMLQRQLPQQQGLIYAVRNAEITANFDNIGDEESCKLLLQRRHQARLMRIDVSRADMVAKLAPHAAYVQHVPFIGVAQYQNLYSMLPAPAWREAALVIRPAHSAESLWHNTHDTLLHHPYDTYDTVTQFFEHAARDKQVVAIYHTLYRTAQDSQIVAALCNAAQNGKKVHVVTELRARFDEANNLQHAHILKQAGVQVLHGAPLYKVHAKATLVQKHNGQCLVHVGTGNYHPHTARFYVDVGLFTRNPHIVADINTLFEHLIYGREMPTQYIKSAPWQLKEFLLHKIAHTTDAITIKLNGLSDNDIADALTQAAKRGVQVRLSVRGMCIVRPQKNLHVRALIGHQLEHARILAFGTRTRGDIWLSSADHMPRNLERRVELLVPVLDPTAQDRLWQALESDFCDTIHTRIRTARGVYKRLPRQPQTDAYLLRQNTQIVYNINFL